MCDVLMASTSLPPVPLRHGAVMASDADLARLMHWFFDGDPPPELAAPALQASEAGALLRRSGAGYNPRIMKTTGSRSSG